MKLGMLLEVDETFMTIWLSRSSEVRVKVGTIFSIHLQSSLCWLTVGYVMFVLLCCSFIVARCYVYYVLLCILTAQCLSLFSLQLMLLVFWHCWLGGR